MPTHQKELYIQVTQADGLISPISKRVGALKLWISSLVSLWPILEDDNGTKWWLLRVPCTVSPPSCHFSRFSTLIMLSLQIPKNFIDIISFSCKSNLALYSKIWLFKDLWRLCLTTCHLTAPPIPSQRFAIACCKKHSFSTNTKINLVVTQIYKVLVVFLLTVLHNCQKIKLVFFIFGWLALR